MSLLEAVILGVVQGLTEFLPVSSSGHLAVIENMLGLGGKEFVAFDVLVHFATFLAILVVLAPDIIRILKTERRVILLLVVGSIPAAAAGFLLEPYMAPIKKNLLAVGICFLATCGVLVLSRVLGHDKKELKKSSLLDSLFVGIAQAIAILPGISRSGSTISTARMLGIKARDAFTLSFLLGGIAIFGATIFEAGDIGSLAGTLGAGVLAAAFAAALVSGIAALIVFKKIVAAGRLHYFAWYLAPVGIATIILYFV